jgi:hypothetical protein
MKTDLNEITVLLKPDLNSVSITQTDFNEAFTAFENKVKNGLYPTTGYCNLTFGKPTHVITDVTRLNESTYQARVGFLEAHPETGEMAKRLLSASLQDQVKWQFAVTRHEDRLEIFSIEALFS